MATASNQITALENQTAYNNTLQNKDRTQSSDNDKNMFLNLMLTQLKHQDPSEPMENTEWLSQLANYSSLEQMTEVNENLGNMTDFLSSLSNDLSTNYSVTQTLSLIGKEVDIAYKDESGADQKVTGRVTEASIFEGSGVIKVNGEYYSIANVQSIREPESTNTEAKQ